MDGSIFQGFTAEIATIEEVNELYTAMRVQHTKARHVICAFRLPGQNFVKFQDYHDDQEWGAGRHVLNAMKYSSMEFRVIFVTRTYEGKYVGISRFEAYLRAARSAVAHSPHIKSRDLVHNIWSKDYCVFSESDVNLTTNAEGNMTLTKNKVPAHLQTRKRGGRRGGANRRQYSRRGRGGRGSLPHQSSMPDDATAPDSSDEESLQRDWAQIAANMPKVKYNQFGLPTGFVSHSPPTQHGNTDTRRKTEENME